MECLGIIRCSVSESSKARSSHLDSGQPLSWGSASSLLTLAIQTAGTVVPEHPNRKVQTLSTPFYVWTFPLLEWPGTIRPRCPFGCASYKRPEAAPKLVLMGFLNAAFYFHQWCFHYYKIPSAIAIWGSFCCSPPQSSTLSCLGFFVHWDLYFTGLFELSGWW